MRHGSGGRKGGMGMGGAAPKMYVAKIRRDKVSAYGTQAEWNAISLRAKELYGNKCARCGRHATTLRQLGIKLEVHHIIPVSRGGRTVIYNLKPLCEDCHARQPGHGHLR